MEDLIRRQGELLRVIRDNLGEGVCAEWLRAEISECLEMQAEVEFYQSIPLGYISM